MTDIYSGIEEYNDGTEYYRPYGTEDYQVEHYRGAARAMRRMGSAGRKVRKLGSAGRKLALAGKKFKMSAKFAGKFKKVGKFGKKFRKVGGAGRKFKRYAGSADRLKKLKRLRKMRKARIAARKAARLAKKGAKKGAKLAKKGAKKGAKLAKKGAKKGAKFARRNKKLLKYAAVAGAIGGGALFLDKKYKERHKKVKECASICLPKNWDAFDQKKIKSTELQYKTLEEVKAAGAVADQPVCSKDIGGGRCESHCISKCEEITKLDLGTVGNAAKSVVNKATNVAGRVAKSGMNVAGKILGPIWKKIKMPFMIILVLIILSVVMKFMPKGRPRAPPPAVY